MEPERDGADKVCFSGVGGAAGTGVGEEQGCFLTARCQPRAQLVAATLHQDRVGLSGQLPQNGSWLPAQRGSEYRRKSGEGDCTAARPHTHSLPFCNNRALCGQEGPRAVQLHVGEHGVDPGSD